MRRLSTGTLAVVAMEIAVSIMCAGAAALSFHDHNPAMGCLNLGLATLNGFWGWVFFKEIP